MRVSRRVLLVLVASLLLIGTPRLAAKNGPLEKALDRLEEARQANDAVAMCRAIEGLAAFEDKRVDRVLKSVAKGCREDKACAEAARTLGLRGGNSNLGFLLGLVKAHRKRPYALIGDFEGIASFASPRATELLYDQSRYFMTRQEPVARSAMEALGRIRCKKAVGRLIQLLEQTVKRQGWGPDRVAPAGPTSSLDATQLAAYRPVLVASLQRLTGQGLESVEDWTDWWRSAKKSFRCPKVPPDPNRRLLFRDEERKFEITRPGANWRWADEPESGFVATCRRQEGESVAAWVSVHVHSTLEEDPITVPGMLGVQEQSLQKRFQAIRESEWSGSMRFAGLAVSRQVVVGSVEGGVFRLTQAVFARGDLMYVVRWAVAEKASPGVSEEQERMTGSFKLLK